MINEKEYFLLLESNIMNEFKKKHNRTVDAGYTDREDRNRFASEQMVKLGGRKILNLGGGGERHLSAQLPGDYQVYEVDIVGDCDLKLNLDKTDSLPFEDKSFDISCAFDVLEHLESFHLMNEEMYRVSRSFVLLSLPISSYEIYHNVLKNKPQKRPDLNRGIFSKYYGLPLVVPEDRHRWWLYFGDIVRYYTWFSRLKNTKVEFWVPLPRGKMGLLKKLIGGHLYYTFFCPHVWVLIERSD